MGCKLEKHECSGRVLARFPFRPIYLIDNAFGDYCPLVKSEEEPGVDPIVFTIVSAAFIASF